MAPEPTVNSGDDFHTSFVSYVKKRHRLEQGRPWKIMSMSSPLDPQGHGPDSEPFSYSNGICVWLDFNEDNTSVIALNLFTNEKQTFTTENREELISVQNAGSIIAALSQRGYCHVWNYDTSQTSSFRVPSTNCLNILISGTKVVLEYAEYLVYWSFDTEIARTLDVEESVVALALHPSEDQITMVHFCPYDQPLREQEITFDDDGNQLPIHYFLPKQQLHTTKYALNSQNEWYTLSSRSEPVPDSFFPDNWIYAGPYATRYGIHPGQSNAVDRVEQAEEGDDGKLHGSVYVSIEPDGMVAIHTVPYELSHGTQFICPERGLLYGSVMGEDHKWEYGILKSGTMRGPSNGYVWYDYAVQRMVDIGLPVRIFGDAQFLIFLKKSTMVVWFMDENATEREKSCEMARLMHN